MTAVLVATGAIGVFLALRFWLGHVWVHLVWLVFDLLFMERFLFEARWGWAVVMALFAGLCVWEAAWEAAYEARKTRTAS